jgi:hypothetical protein
MKNIWMAILALLLSAAAHSKGVTAHATIQASIYADGILLQANNPEVNLELMIMGPGKERTTRKIMSSSVFMDIRNLDGEELADGYYKWEAWPTPVVTYSREESAVMPDRNSLSHKNSLKVSALSGSFRIVNGLIADPELVEYSKEDVR